ncbi:hypothetical protein BDZ45DRAFT_378171 [Acephala macrosclerotiorum]|nr:hypothetical protein BDZ45DRAFT_378171 [Acephala macrosclerotiorum]
MTMYPIFDNSIHRNPAGIGKWLAAKCLSLGVEIRTGLKVVGASLSSHNKVQAVTCLDDGESPTRIDCSRLLIACGPWTPVTYEKLFPSSPIQLQSSVNAGDWLVCKSPCPTTFESTAFVSLANIVGEKLEFAGRNDGTIWCCGKRNFTASLPAPGEIDEPDEAVIEELCGYARRWLNTSCKCTSKHVDELEIVGTGRAFRPSTKSGLPIISQVKPWDLTGASTNTDQVLNASSGVFVSWGHGSYGLTLGMGMGKLMSQLMCGQKPDLDLSLFDLALGANERLREALY